MAMWGQCYKCMGEEFTHLKKKKCTCRFYVILNTWSLLTPEREEENLHKQIKILNHFPNFLRSYVKSSSNTQFKSFSSMLHKVIFQWKKGVSPLELQVDSLDPSTYESKIFIEFFYFCKKELCIFIQLQKNKPLYFLF